MNKCAADCFLKSLLLQMASNAWKKSPFVVRTISVRVWNDLVAHEFEKLFSSIFSPDIPEVEYGVALGRIFVVPAHLSVLEDANVVLVHKGFYMAQAHDFAIVFPCDAVVCKPLFNKERDEFFNGEMRSDGTEKECLTTAVFDDAKRDHTITHDLMIRTIHEPEIVFGAMENIFGIHHVRLRQFLEPLAMGR